MIDIDINRPIDNDKDIKNPGIYKKLSIKYNQSIYDVVDKNRTMVGKGKDKDVIK